MANRYWVGGTAAWDATAGTKWALTSGGAGGQAVPTTADDVFFNAASGAGTVTVATALPVKSARSLNFTGFTGTFVQSGATINVAGNAIFSSSMTYTINATSVMTIVADSTISANGKSLPNMNVAMGGSAVSGLLTFTDTTLNLVGGISISNAQAQLNNKTLNVGRYFLMGAGISGKYINLNSSTMTLNVGLVPVNSNLEYRSTNVAVGGFTVDLTNFVLNLSSGYKYTVISNVSSWAIPTLNVGNDAVVILPGSSVGRLHVTNLNLGSNVNIFGIARTINVATINTTSANLSTMSYIGAYVQSGVSITVNCPSGNVVLRNMIIKDVTFTGGATFTAVDSFVIGTTPGLSDITYPSSIKYSSI